ncbi:hypothetical protein Tco_1089237 [Tanacetum coccineum]
MVIESFLITKNLMGYVDGSIPCPSKTLSITDDATVIKENPNYPICVSNNAHVHMLIISTISKASFRHVQGTTSHDLSLSLEKAYAPHSTSREYTLKTQLLRIEMHGDETPDAYLNRAQEYATLIACTERKKLASLWEKFESHPKAAFLPWCKPVVDLWIQRGYRASMNLRALISFMVFIYDMNLKALILGVPEDSLRKKSAFAAGLYNVASHKYNESSHSRYQ